METPMTTYNFTRFKPNYKSVTAKGETFDDAFNACRALHPDFWPTHAFDQTTRETIAITA